MFYFYDWTFCFIYIDYPLIVTVWLHISIWSRLSKATYQVSIHSTDQPSSDKNAVTLIEKVLKSHWFWHHHRCLNLLLPFLFWNASLFLSILSLPLHNNHYVLSCQLSRAPAELTHHTVTMSHLHPFFFLVTKMLQLIFFFFNNSRQDQCTTEIQCHMALFITNQISGCSTTRHKGRQQRIGGIGDKVHIMLQNVSISQMGLSLVHTPVSSKPKPSISVGMVSLFRYQTVYFLCWSVPV